MTTTIIVSIALILGLVGVSTIVWSIVNTRKKHYEDYKSRKRNK
jgi:cbb3-type cytochrome oxidase maturation protein